VISPFERRIYGFGGADVAEAMRFLPGMNRAFFEGERLHEELSAARPRRARLLRLRAPFGALLA